jgi:hypothetical protein
MRLINTFLPGQKVKLLDKATLIAAGWENNDDKDDFLNLLAGKEITLDEVFENGQIYTCKEHPGYAIYKVFIDKVVSVDNLSFKDISIMIGGKSAESFRRFTKQILKKLSGSTELKMYYED